MAAMWGGISSPDEFFEMDAHASDMLGREVLLMRKAELDLRLEIAKAQIRATGATVR